MEITSSRLGVISYKKDDIIVMARGLLGFDDFKRFIMVCLEDQKPFCWLQSTDDPNLAFPVIDPLLVKPDFKIETSSKDLALLEAKSDSDLSVCLIVTIPKGRVETVSVNTQAPIVINKSQKKAIQLIINDSGYVTQLPIFKTVLQRLADNL